MTKFLRSKSTGDLVTRVSLRQQRSSVQRDANTGLEPEETSWRFTFQAHKLQQLHNCMTTFAVSTNVKRWPTLDSLGLAFLEQQVLISRKTRHRWTSITVPVLMQGPGAGGGGRRASEQHPSRTFSWPHTVNHTTALLSAGSEWAECWLRRGCGQKIRTDYLVVSAGIRAAPAWIQELNYIPKGWQSGKRTARQGNREVCLPKPD